MIPAFHRRRFASKPPYCSFCLTAWRPGMEMQDCADHLAERTASGHEWYEVPYTNVAECTHCALRIPYADVTTGTNGALDPCFSGHWGPLATTPPPAPPFVFVDERPAPPARDEPVHLGCRHCARELCSMDAYYGRDPALEALCYHCRSRLERALRYGEPTREQAAGSR